MSHKIRDDRQLRALTGLGFAEFERLLSVFGAVYEAERQNVTSKRCKPANAAENQEVDAEANC